MQSKISSFEEYQKVYDKSVKDPEGFWGEIAGNLQWRKKWDKVLDWNFETADAKWFINGKMNITENCLDRHLEKNGDKIAYIFEANDVNEVSRKITYKELHAEVCRFANVLKKHGAKKGDRICIYMPMIPEAVIAM